MSPDIDQLQRDVEAARSAYATAEKDVVARLSEVFADGRDAAAQVLDIAEEYGADPAAVQLVADPERFGACRADAETQLATHEIEAAIEAALSARDRLDQAARRRTEAQRLAEPDTLQVLTFGGRAFVVDPRRGELRSVDNPTERYLLVEPPDRPAPSMAASPPLPDEPGRDVPVAQPTPATDRKPDRSR